MFCRKNSWPRARTVEMISGLVHINVGNLRDVPVAAYTGEILIQLGPLQVADPRGSGDIIRRKV
jgi:hypothetical protein